MHKLAETKNHTSKDMRVTGGSGNNRKREGLYH